MYLHASGMFYTGCLEITQCAQDKDEQHEDLEKRKSYEDGCEYMGEELHT